MANSPLLSDYLIVFPLAFSLALSDFPARLVGSQQHQHHNESSCSSGPDSPRHAHSHSHPLHGGGGATGGPSSAGGTGSGGGDGGGTGAIPKNLPALETPMGSGGGGLAGSGQGQAQYLSASCVVFTNYSGDTASQVDEHFSRALNYNNKDSKGKCAAEQFDNLSIESPLL